MNKILIINENKIIKENVELVLFCLFLFICIEMIVFLLVVIIILNL